MFNCFVLLIVPADEWAYSGLTQLVVHCFDLLSLIVIHRISRLGSAEGTIHALDLFMISKISLCLVNSYNWIISALRPLTQKPNVVDLSAVASLRLWKE